MSEVACVAIGGALGSALLMLLYRRPPSAQRVLAVNICGSTLLGAFAAVQPSSLLWSALIGTGLLSNAAPLVSALLVVKPIDGSTRIFALVRRAASMLAINAFFGFAFALAGFLAVQITITAYYKLMWY